MKRAALYARVSSDAQKQERTIDSQVVELRAQIAASGLGLVKEYIDDGYSGAQLDRPALNDLRADVKKDGFDAIYFLNTDRIARDVAYQTIIIGELLKHGKQIIINGQDYVHNSENKFTLTVLGAVAELERTKIMERMARGRLHRLRSGQVLSQGSCVYGYDYQRKTPTSPPALIINEGQAAIVRSVFETYASGHYGLAAISRSLEARGVLTRMGKPHWDREHMRKMLRNETYAGTRYYNRMTTVKEGLGDRRRKRGRFVERDRTQWIAVSVPAIVSQELFDKVQERLRLNTQRYRQPDTRYLLSGLVSCGECGHAYSSYRRYVKTARAGGRLAVYHRAGYRCNWRAAEAQHDVTRIERCRNSEIATHLLEGRVFDLLRDVMLDAGMLRRCIDRGKSGDAYDGHIARELSQVAEASKAAADKRRRMMEQYALEQMPGDEYIAENRALDAELERLKARKTALVSAIRLPERDRAKDLAISRFCDVAKAHLERCTDFDTKRQFLLDHVEKVVYQRYHVTVVGSVPVQDSAGSTAIEFRIEGKITKAMLHSKTRPYLPDHSFKLQEVRQVQQHSAQPNLSSSQ